MTGRNFRSTARALAAGRGSTLSDDELEEWVGEERQAVTDHLRRVLRPHGEVTAALHKLAATYRLGVVTSSASSRLAACLEATALSGLFPPDSRFSAEDSLPAPTTKPDPAVYRWACKRMGVAPSGAVAIEDSVPGVESAVAAGVPTVGNVTFVPAAERPRRTTDLRAAGARPVAASWSQLSAWLA
jgi:beta-phosphoglucomutase-like phosphatase (HAD superfamily)